MQSPPLFDSTQTPYQGILHSSNPCATGSIPVQHVQGDLSREVKNELGATTPVPMSASRPSTMKFSYPRKYHRILWLYSKDYRYRSFSSINSHTFIIFVLEDKIQKPGEVLVRCSLGGCVMGQRSGDGWSKDFPTFEILDARSASALNKIIQNSTSTRRSVWRNRKLRKRIGFFDENRSLI